jgi:hypothetical protein
MLQMLQISRFGAERLYPFSWKFPQNLEISTSKVFTSICRKSRFERCACWGFASWCWALTGRVREYSPSSWSSSTILLKVSFVLNGFLLAIASFAPFFLCLPFFWEIRYKLRVVWEKTSEWGVFNFSGSGPSLLKELVKLTPNPECQTQMLLRYRDIEFFEFRTWQTKGARMERREGR